jgi:hypothetical protein
MSRTPARVQHSTGDLTTSQNLHDNHSPNAQKMNTSFTVQIPYMALSRARALHVYITFKIYARAPDSHGGRDPRGPLLGPLCDSVGRRRGGPTVCAAACRATERRSVQWRHESSPKGLEPLYRETRRRLRHGVAPAATGLTPSTAIAGQCCGHRCCSGYCASATAPPARRRSRPPRRHWSIRECSVSASLQKNRIHQSLHNDRGEISTVSRPGPYCLIYFVVD